MLHPIFSLLIRRPELALDHVAGYAALVQQEASSASTQWLKRCLGWALVVVATTVFLVLAGVAAMLGVMQNQFQWILVLVPGVALLLVLWALNMARQPLQGEAFAEVKAQLDADLQALQAAGAKRNA
ncbi:MAG: hypothetical protein V4562_12790 [Pseudomonadota bacterium]